MGGFVHANKNPEACGSFVGFVLHAFTYMLGLNFNKFVCVIGTLERCTRNVILLPNLPT